MSLMSVPEGRDYIDSVTRDILWSYDKYDDACSAYEIATNHHGTFSIEGVKKAGAVAARFFCFLWNSFTGVLVVRWTVKSHDDAQKQENQRHIDQQGWVSRRFTNLTHTNRDPRFDDLFENECVDQLKALHDAAGW